MKENIKISVYIGFVFLVSFGILFSYLVMYEKGYFDIQESKVWDRFGNKILQVDERNKIFLLGPSYVEAINTAHIQNILNDNGMNVVIKWEDDRDTSKVVEIDDFISKKTDLIVYGIAFLELGIQPCYDPVHQQALLEHAIENLPLNIDNTIQNIFANNPKQITIEILKKFLEKPEIIQIDNKSNLEYQKLSDDWKETTQKIRPISDLNKGGELLYPHLQIRAGGDDKYCFNSDAHNAKLDKFDKIFAKLKLNEIDVIVFIPPFTKGHLDMIPDEAKSYMINDVQTISKKYGYDFIDMSNRYEELDIWQDHVHVAKNPVSLIYSKDIALLILSNLSKEFIPFNISEDFLEKDLRGVNLQYQDLSNLDLSGMDLSGAILYGANFTNTNLTSANLSNSKLMHVDLSGKDLHGTILTGADLSGATLTHVDLSGKDLHGTILIGADLSGAILTGVDLSESTLTHAYLYKKDLRGINLTGADLSESILKGADLRGTILTDVDLSGKDLHGTILTGADLSGATLTHVDLSGKDLRNTILTNTDFTGSNLNDVNFAGANLDDAIGTIFLGCIGHHLCN